jgi:hypothetical protein
MHYVNKLTLSLRQLLIAIARDVTKTATVLSD